MTNDSLFKSSFDNGSYDQHRKRERENIEYKICLEDPKDVKAFQTELNKLKLLEDFNLIYHHNPDLNFEYVSNLYVLHIKMKQRRNYFEIFPNFIDYDIHLYANNHKFVYEGFKGKDTTNISYNLKLIKEEI